MVFVVFVVVVVFVVFFVVVVFVVSLSLMPAAVWCVLHTYAWLKGASVVIRVR